jgi:cytoskeletal protein RodZ
MEGLGKKLQEARKARNLTLDDAYRMTKIRPNRLEAIENEDFSMFDSLAYSKAAVLIYGKFLEVDVSPYLEAFETSEHVTTDGYAYLQDAPEPEPSRPVVVRRRSSSSSSGGNRGSLLPFIIGVLVLVIGFIVMKWVMQMQRLTPRPTPAPGSSPIATASDKIIAPHAQPVDSSTPQAVAPAPTLAPTPIPTITPSVPAPAAAEPEVRRAEPVHPEEIAKLPTPTPRPSATPRRSPRPRPSLTPSVNVTPATTVRPR